MTWTKIMTPPSAAAGSNPNLLDNWFFVDPINQRGQKEYDSTAADTYTIDRWACWTGDMSVKLEDGYIHIEEGGRKDASLFQPIGLDFDKSLLGRTITVSVLTKDGNLVTGTVRDINATTGRKLTVNSPDGQWYTGFHLTDAYVLRYFICANRGGIVEPVAAKVEFGDHQTLAEQAADGTWRLLDAPPNKQQELAKCQKYQLVFGGDAGDGNAIGVGVSVPKELAYPDFSNYNVVVPTPVTMRKLPKAYVANGALTDFVLQTSFTNMDHTYITSITPARVSPGNLLVNVKLNSQKVAATNYVYDQTVIFRKASNKNAKLIFDANL